MTLDPKLAERLFRQLKAWLRENVEPRYFPVRSPAYSPANDPRGPFVDLWQTENTATP
jgi:hypothetical protein